MKKFNRPDPLTVAFWLLFIGTLFAIWITMDAFDSYPDDGLTVYPTTKGEAK